MSKQTRAGRALAQDAKDELTKGFSIFGLAWKNIFSYAWMNLKLCFTFACLAFLICLFTVYNAAIDRKKTEYIESASSSNYIMTEKKSTVEEIQKLCPYCGDVETYTFHSFNTAISDAYGYGGKFVADSSFFVLEVEGKQYSAVETRSFTTVAHPSDSFFRAEDYTELKATYGLDSFFLEGGYPTKNGEVAIALPMLETYLLTPEDVFGKVVTVYLKDPREGKTPLVPQYSAKVCGIIREECIKLSGHKDAHTRPYFLMSHENDFVKKSVFHRYRVYLNAWPEVEEIDAWKAMFLSDTTLLYGGTASIEKVNTLNGLQVLSSNLYIIVGSALIIGLVLTVFLMIDKYVKVFCRTGGILMTFGMRRSTLFALLFSELLILCVLAIPIALVLTTGGYFAINAIVRYLTTITLGISLRRIAGIFFLGIGAVTGLAMIFFGYAALRLRSRPIKDLLRTELD